MLNQVGEKAVKAATEQGKSASSRQIIDSQVSGKRNADKRNAHKVEKAVKNQKKAVKARPHSGTHNQSVLASAQ